MKAARLKRHFLLVNLMLAVAVGGLMVGVLPSQFGRFVYEHVASELEMAAGAIALSMQAYEALQDLTMLQEISRIIEDNPDVGTARIYLDSGSGPELLASIPFEVNAAEISMATVVAAGAGNAVVREFAGDKGETGVVVVIPDDARLQAQMDDIKLGLAGLFAMFLTIQLYLLTFVSGNLLRPLHLIEEQLLLQATDLLPPARIPQPGQLEVMEFPVFMTILRSERSIARVNTLADDGSEQSAAGPR